MLFSSAEAKEHTWSYVTEVYVTQKKEKMPSYLLFARLSARSNPSSDFVVKMQKTHENVCFFVFGGELSPLYELRKSDIGAASLD